MFNALDDSGDFKIPFIHQFFIIVNIFLVNNSILHQMLGVSSMFGSQCVGCFYINKEKILLTFAMPPL